MLTMKLNLDADRMARKAGTTVRRGMVESGEWEADVVVSQMETTAPHGALSGRIQSRERMAYNLDAIVFPMVGKRVLDFSNGWKNGGWFFQWLEKVARVFPMVGKRGRRGAAT